ncbi:MAG: NADAR family protein [Myxococcales bacterium]|nr:NADAR family protein [Myxococcales bacterium]
MFWGHRAQPDDAVGAGVLSQWWPCAFEVEGQTYCTAEHFMMAEKARLFDDAEALQRILTHPDPRRAKAVGRTVRGFDEATWREHRMDIVVRGNRAKFGQQPQLRDFLIETGESVLVEASPHDRIWGIGLAASDPRASDPGTWRGQNLLGFALMQVRADVTHAA